MTDIDWKTEARKWEARSKENKAEADKLETQLTVERAKTRSWRDAYHILKEALEDRLDRVTHLLQEWEPEPTDETNHH